MTVGGTPGESPVRPIDQEIRALKGRVLEMGAWALGMVEDGTRAFRTRDSNLAEEVVRRDVRLDLFDVEIEQEAVRFLIRRQPAARDVRLATSILKIITYLDRIGRYGYDVARATDPPPPPLEENPDLPVMAKRATAMVRAALDAFDAQDPRRAARIYEEDEPVDELHRKILSDEIRRMTAGGAEVETAARRLMVSRYLERVADNACKIAEKTIYSATGHRRSEFLHDGKHVRL